MNRSRQVTSNPTQPHVQRWVVEREDEYARTWVDLDSHERRIEYLEPAEMSDRIADKLTMTLALANALHVPVVEPGPVSITAPDPITHDTALPFYLSAMAFAMSVAALFISIVT